MPFEVASRLCDGQRDLLAILTRRVRVLSVAQIARTWPKCEPRLKRLEEQGLIHSFMTVVHPELPLLIPVIRWQDGDETPDFSKASYALRSRWSQSATPMRCIIASRAAGRMFGGHGGRYPRESEETHDIHHAAVYLRFRLLEPVLSTAWIHEEEIKKERKTKRGKLPDALVAGRRVMEFGGAYKKPKLIAFHRFCIASGFEYEVW